MAGRLSSTLRFAPARVDVEKRTDGTMVLRSPERIEFPSETVGQWLDRWGSRAPQRTFLAERSGDGWRRLTYADALEQGQRIGEGLLARNLTVSKPIAILADNSIDHGLLALGAMYVGLTVAPISTAYALMSRDYGKLKYIFELLEPELTWTSDPRKFGAALDAVGAKPTSLAEIIAKRTTTRVNEASRAVRPDAIAKILFTSGSTGMPKGVINTHRMITANQRQCLAVWPFIAELPPLVVDWLPWNHTFGGNYDFFMVLSNGGTMYIDAGKPAPGLIELSVKNLCEISPNMYFNVPRGFDLLIPYLEGDAELRRSFFRNLRFVFYAGAALPQNLWERFEGLAIQERGGDLALVSAWGSTETAPLAAAVHYPIERAGIIGLPVPGCDIKLVPSGGKLEVRVRGPNVTLGYFRDDALTRDAFDEEGFYRIGDALRFADSAAPEKGLVFDGRVAEDFKLTTGTWVNTGVVRLKLIAAADPIVQDAVITGHDCDQVGAIVFLNPAITSGWSAVEIRTRLVQVLRSLAADPGSSTHPVRCIVADEPPSIDANEITDKGYINQRAVRERRSHLVAVLHAPTPRPEVITC